MDKLTDFIDLIRIRNMLLALITVTKMCEWSFLRNCNLNFFYETDVVGNIELRFVLGKIKSFFGHLALLYNNSTRLLSFTTEKYLKWTAGVASLLFDII